MSATRDASKAFWSSRARSQRGRKAHNPKSKRISSLKTNTSQMRGFVRMIAGIAEANGCDKVMVSDHNRAALLPGFFQPQTSWSIIAECRGNIAAAIRLDWQVGPSCEAGSLIGAHESIGLAENFWAAFRKGVFGDVPRPFLGWLMLVEDAEATRSPVRDHSPHFPVFPEFQNASYLDRYHLLCKKLMHEQLYTSATVLASPHSASKDGRFTCHDDMTGLSSFVSSFAGHIAAAAARKA